MSRESQSIITEPPIMEGSAYKRSWARLALLRSRTEVVGLCGSGCSRCRSGLDQLIITRPSAYLVRIRSGPRVWPNLGVGLTPMLVPNLRVGHWVVQITPNMCLPYHQRSDRLFLSQQLPLTFQLKWIFLHWYGKWIIPTLVPKIGFHAPFQAYSMRRFTTPAAVITRHAKQSLKSKIIQSSSFIINVEWLFEAT